MIFGVTIVNAVIGFIQESKAENAIAALAESVTTEATILLYLASLSKAWDLSQKRFCIPSCDKFKTTHLLRRMHKLVAIAATLTAVVLHVSRERDVCG